jgi:hypothetical protein
MFPGMRCLTLARVGCGESLQSDVGPRGSRSKVGATLAATSSGLSPCRTQGNNYGPEDFTTRSPLLLRSSAGGFPGPRQGERRAGFSLRQ